MTVSRLGFSTQVPMNACFLTSGSSRKLTLGKRTITLRHGSPKNFAYKGKLMPELVQARFQRFTSSLHQKTEMIIDIIRIYSYCHEQNHRTIPADGKIVLSFFMRGCLLSPFSLIVRSFGQVSFGHLAKSARYFSHSSKSISSDRLPLPI